MPLTKLEAKNAKAKEKTYRLSDEKGMYLEVTPKAQKYWRLKYRFNGKEKRLALGVFPETSLAEARDKRDDARQKLKQGIDPSQAKQAEKLARQHASENSFEAISQEWLRVKMNDKSEGHQKRTRRLLEKDLFPHIGRLPIQDITVPQLLEALRKIEARGAIETAHRAKQTAGQVFLYAKRTGRAEHNPSADLTGALSTHKAKNLPSITAPKEVGKLMAAIDGYQGTATVKAALKISPMLLARPGEIRHMEWTEIDWDRSLWEIPAEKMKMKEAHIVPLCNQAINILKEQQKLTGRGVYVFPSPRGASRPLSENGVRTALRTLGYDNDTITPHGFRAMGRTLLDEILGFRVEWIEQQLAHTVRDALGRAYNRTTYLPQRKDMMQKWADYLDNLKAEALPGNIISGNCGST